MITKRTINRLQEQCSYKDWVKFIPMYDIVLFNNYNNKSYFREVADISLNNEDKSSTLIKFNNLISKTEFNSKNEWLYLFTIDDVIVKIGGTRTGLKSRASSYLCGHYIKERNKSGDCSKTNGYIYNTFHFYLLNGSKIKMYGYKLPSNELQLNILEKEVTVYPQTFHAYESTFLNDFRETYTAYPILNNNRDPDY